MSHFIGETSGSPIRLKIVSENRFSGKTYSFTIAPSAPKSCDAAADNHVFKEPVMKEKLKYLRYFRLVTHRKKNGKFIPSPSDFTGWSNRILHKKLCMQFERCYTYSKNGKRSLKQHIKYRVTCHLHSYIMLQAILGVLLACLGSS